MNGWYGRFVQIFACAFAIAGFLFYQVTYAPVAGSIDDYVRYHLGVRMAVLRATDPPAADLEARKILSLTDELRAQGVHPYGWRAFLYAAVPYTPIEIPILAAVDALASVRRARGHPLHAWDAAANSVFWFGFFGLCLGLVVVGRKRPLLQGAWFLSTGVLCGAVLLDGAPFLPFPRAMSILATGLAAHLLEGDAHRRPRRGAAGALLVFAAFAHPYQQAMNLVAFTLFLFFWTWGREDLRARENVASATRWALCAAIPVLASLGLVRLLTPPDLWAVWMKTPTLAAGTAEVLSDAWDGYRRALKVGVALVPLFALWRWRSQRGIPATAGLALVFFAPLEALWLLQPMDADAIFLRVGDGFLVPLLYLLLRRNLFLDLLTLPPARRAAGLAAATAIAAILLGIYYKGFQVEASLGNYPFSGSPPVLEAQDLLILDYLEGRR